MSLINQMLQDLAKRQTSGTNILSQISAIPAQTQHKKIPIWVWLSVTGFISINVLGWLWWHTPPSKPQIIKTPPATQHVPQPPIVVAATTPAPKPIALISAPPTNEISSHPATEHTSFMQLTHSLNLSKPLASKPADKPVTPDDPTPSMPTSISKQLKPLTNAQLAENEYRKALALAQQGHVNDGIEGLVQSLALDPRHHAARLTLVGLLIDNKRMGEAEKRLLDGLTLDIEQTDFAMILARLQVDRGSINDGIATLEHSLPYAATQADYQAFLAALLQRNGRHKSAIEHYIVALKKSPQSGVWWMGLGISLKADNQPDKAHEAFTRAKDSNSLSPELLAFVNQQLS